MAMYSPLLRLCLAIIVPYVSTQQTIITNSFRAEKHLHLPTKFNEVQLNKLASMTNITHMNEALDNICVVRFVGSNGHAKVKKYLIDSMTDLGWNVETDLFEDTPPGWNPLKFENIIATLNPNASRFLALACHFDSLYTKDKNFVGATDSAVPCSQLLNLATVMRNELESAKRNSVSLMFIFFDGEEAFKKWSATDSIYGARHLAQKWENKKRNLGVETISELDRIDLLMLLDLLGGSHPRFYNYFEDTTRWFTTLADAERSLADLRKFDNYSYGSQPYFRTTPEWVYYPVEDDHLPFLNRDVPILHVIPRNFPQFWHTTGDNRDIIDMETTENLNKILRVFVASYLNLTV